MNTHSRSLLAGLVLLTACGSPEVDSRGEEVARLAEVFAALDTESAAGRASAIEALEALELDDPDTRTAQDACARYILGIGEAEDAANAVRERVAAGEQGEEVNEALGRAALILEDSELAGTRCSQSLDRLQIRL